MPKYANLLSPFLIGDTIIKNRMLSSYVLPKYMQGPEEFPSEHYTAFFANIAKNGAGIVDLCRWDEYPNQRNGPLTLPHTHMPAFDLSNPATHNYISELTEEIHLYGSKALIGLSPRTVLAPRRMTNKDDMFTIGKDGLWLPDDTPEEIVEQYIQKYVDMVQLYVDCGFDGVSDRLDGSLCPMASDGSAETGKTVEFRTRFELQCFKRLKERYGPGFIIEGVMSGQQPHGYTGLSNVGYSLEEFLEFCHLADGIIDIMQVRNQDMISVHPTGFTFHKGEHECLSYIKAMQDEGIGIKTIAIGGFQDPEEMDQLIAAGKCDMIGMARAFMADYDYYQKIEEGCSEDIRPCIWCNSCHGPTYDTGKHGPWVNRCTVNPELGFEARHQRLVKDPGKEKKVAIIGGGVAGMQAAITTAQRGHKVTLFEATDYLGGQLYHAESFSFKWPLRDFKNWQVHQLNRLGVDIRLNTRATPEQIAQEQFDAVIAATGAVPSFPQNIQGLRSEDGAIRPEYRHSHDVFGKEAELGKHVVIVGGSETGVETALYLLENGHDVTILTRQAKIAPDASKSHYITLTWMDTNRGDGRADESPEWTKYDNLINIVNATTTHVDGNTVYYTDGDGVEHSVSGDSIVINGGVKPLQEEALSFYGSAKKFYVIGDANGIGNVQKCVREGWSRANLI